MTTQYWITGASGDWSDAADWASDSVPTSTDGAVISSSNVTVNGTAAAYSLTLDNSYLTVSGALTLGASLTLDDGAQLALSGGTLSAQTISANYAGYLSGYGTVGGAVNGVVYITADGGALQVQGSLTGDQGTFTIDVGASLELSNGDAAPVIFEGGSATLKLDAPAAFTGAIEQVVVGDVIDLAGIGGDGVFGLAGRCGAGFAALVGVLSGEVVEASTGVEEVAGGAVALMFVVCSDTDLASAGAVFAGVSEASASDALRT